jgi:AcrR family transcriptional regulator
MLHESEGKGTMKRQKQIDESKDMIAAAFVDLIHNHDFNGLTLNEIADKAGVNRMTIYRHFKTKERIVLYCARKNLKELEARVSGEEKPYRELIYQRLEWIQTLPNLPIIMSSREIEELLDSFMMDAHLEALEKAIGISFSDNPQIFYFYFGGLNRISKEWLKNGCIESSREIADKIINLTQSFVMMSRSMISGSSLNQDLMSKIFSR